MRKCAIRRLVAAFAVLFLLTDPAARGAAANSSANRPPAAIVPTSATLNEVLGRVEAAGGREPTGPRFERWTFASGGVSGNQRATYDGDDYRVTTQYGPFTFEHGRRHQQRWRQNANGLTLLLKGSADRSDAVALALHIQGGVRATASGTGGARAGGGGNAPIDARVRLVGEVALPSAAYVIEITPPGERSGWIFVEKSTGHVIRAAFSYPSRLITLSASDFRETDGVVRARHIHVSDCLSPGNDADWTLEEYQTNAAISPADLEIPENAKVFDRFPDGVTKVVLPARFVDSHVYVRAVVGERPAYMILDSGTSDIVVDRAFARRLGLKEYGHTTGVTAGTYVQSQVQIPEVRVGKIALRDVAAYSVPLRYRIRDIDVVGLLGFDFFADAVVHIDYFHERVEVIDQSAFDSSTLRRAVETRVSLDAGVPVATARIGSSSGRFIIDTGSSSVVLYSRFARRHPADVADAGAGAAMHRLVPKLGASAVGGELELTPIELRTFAFAGNDFHHFIVQRVEGTPSFEVEGADGLIGYEFLQYFDLYFDYVNDRVLLVPNAWMQQARAKAPV